METDEDGPWQEQMEQAREEVYRSTTATILGALARQAPTRVTTSMDFELPVPVPIVPRLGANTIELVSVTVSVERYAAADDDSIEGLSSVIGHAYALKADGTRDKRQPNAFRTQLPEALVAPLLLRSMTRTHNRPHNRTQDGAKP